jgi:hypothetical protein
VILTLAVLGGWDILRRLLPAVLPSVLGKIICVAGAWSLLRWAPGSMILSLSAFGGLILVSNLVPAEPYTPWGEYVSDLIQLNRSRKARVLGREAHKRTKPGRRLPTL